MFLQEQTWLMDIIRMLLASVDYVVFSLIKWVIYLIFDISQLTANSEVLNAIYHRTYLILAIFMAFKLSFSFFQYIVNPDAMVDKKQGVGKLLQNVIIMLAALIALPNILFGTNGDGLLVRAQNAFLPMVPRLILGINTGSAADGAKAKDDTIAKASDEMAAQVLIAFFTPKRDELEQVCKNYDDDKIPELDSLEHLTSLVNTSCETNVSRFEILGIPVKTARYYYYSYAFIASTICGLIILAILIGMLLDVAKRVFKMIILQVIAPIPIMSLIDPDSYQKGAFGAWMHQLINTYIEVFLKIGILYIVIMLIQLITTKGLFGAKENFPTFSNQPIRTALLVVALIIGLFQFASEAPKFIKDALGIKDKGSGGGNTGKVLGGVAKGARAVGGAASGAVGGALHGDMAAGAIQGATAAASAKPGQSAHAFRAGSDRAAQLRTGDDKYKTGFGASLQRRVGAHAGYSTHGYQNFKKQATADEADAKNKEELAQTANFEAARADQLASKYKLQAETSQKEASSAESLFSDFQKSGAASFAAWSSTQSKSVQDKLAAAGVTDQNSFNRYVSRKNNDAKKYQSAYEKAQQDARTKHNDSISKQQDAAAARKKADSSAKAKESYEKGMAKYGVSGKSESGLAGVGYKAMHGNGTRADGDGGIAGAVHRGTRAVVDAAEGVRGVGSVVRSIDSAHQQHRLNEIARGDRADNFVYNGAGGFESEAVNRSNARRDLDAQGTIQSGMRDFADSTLGRPGTHDGHFGRGGPQDGRRGADGGTRHGGGA